LVGRIRHNLHLGAQLDQFVGQSSLGIAQNEIVIPAGHLARQSRHHVGLGVSENDDATISRLRFIVAHFSLLVFPLLAEYLGLLGLKLLFGEDTLVLKRAQAFELRNRILLLRGGRRGRWGDWPLRDLLGRGCLLGL
jgi:hypothetical protein